MPKGKDSEDKERMQRIDRVLQDLTEIEQKTDRLAAEVRAKLARIAAELTFLRERQP